MRILRIILCQNETHKYKAWPRNLTTENGLYDLRLEQDWSLAMELGRDEERLVHKFKEYNITSSVCNRLNVVMTPDDTFDGPELVSLDDTVIFDKKNRFVNVHVDPLAFNRSTDSKKRKIIIEAIKEALLLVVDHGFEDDIVRICDDVYTVADELECLFKTKTTKKYKAQIWVKNKATGFTAKLCVKNLKTQMESQTILFEDKHLAYFLISLHKMEIKGGKCIIYSDPVYEPGGESIVVDIDI